MQRHTLEPAPAATTVLERLIASGYAADAARQLIARGAVWSGRNRVLDPNAAVAAGEGLVIQFPPSGRHDEVDLGSSDLLYEDSALVAVAKRRGWVVQETPWDVHGNVRAALTRFLQARDGRAPQLHLVHRLDRGTSGVLVFGKRPDASARLAQAFTGRAVQKEYLAIVHGVPERDEFVLRTGHTRGALGRFRLTPLDEVGRTRDSHPKVREAHTRFRTLRRYDDHALVAAYPITGRTHQIRLHLAAAGHPVIGDSQYGGPRHLRGARYDLPLLHAYRLSLPHPFTGEPLRLEAPLDALEPIWSEL